MTRFLHRERNVWPHCLAVHNDSLDDSPVRYSLLIQAPSIKRCKVKQISQLCTYYLDVFRDKMELPLKSYPDWAFSAAQLRYRINTSLLLQGILLNTQSMGPCRSWSLQAMYGICVRRVPLEPARCLQEPIRDEIRRTCRSSVQVFNLIQ